MQIHFTEQAQNSLNEFILFIAKDNPEYAKTFVQWLVTAVSTLLTTMPSAGMPYTKNTRYVVKKKYVFLYTVNNNRVDILDVFRSGKNWKE